jgi:hypothetical protein
MQYNDKHVKNVKVLYRIKLLSDAPLLYAIILQFSKLFNS